MGIFGLEGKAAATEPTDDAVSDRRDDLKEEFEAVMARAWKRRPNPEILQTLQTINYCEKEAAYIKALVEAVRQSASNGEESPVTGEVLLEEVACGVGFTECRMRNPEDWAANFCVRCFAFRYRAAEQVFCAPSEVARDSWIDREHVVFDVEKFAKEAEAGGDEAATVAAAALDISKKAEKVERKVKEEGRSKSVSPSDDKRMTIQQAYSINPNFFAMGPWALRRIG
ncbi:hypothetical protein cyc_07051 [Cyclospora cayetanensis]|uniref:Uncharacterized protein n=1 Tax=Cyclospora cayetanensis TaxID=88456 RepID=A0A1D3CZP2_9EIME|nr:hypothetical protein cyc_07051 [Cyclospora cayetanensis]